MKKEKLKLNYSANFHFVKKHQERKKTFINVSEIEKDNIFRFLSNQIILKYFNVWAIQKERKKPKSCKPKTSTKTVFSIVQITQQ